MLEPLVESRAVELQLRGLTQFLDHLRPLAAAEDLVELRLSGFPERDRAMESRFAGGGDRQNFRASIRRARGEDEFSLEQRRDQSRQTGAIHAERFRDVRHLCVAAHGEHEQ